MKRRTGVLAAFAGAATLSLGLAIGTGAPAMAAPATSMTQTVHQTWDINNTSVGPKATNPCTGNLLTGTARTNLVNHLTTHGDEVWATFTETDNVSVTDIGTGETFSGELTFWGNFNLNQQNTNTTFTANGELRGNQGDSIAFHQLTVFVMNAKGQVTVNINPPMTFTCG